MSLLKAVYAYYTQNYKAHRDMPVDEFKEALRLSLVNRRHIMNLNWIWLEESLERYGLPIGRGGFSRVYDNGWDNVTRYSVINLVSDVTKEMKLEDLL